jgi:hypothetical protein
MIWAYKGVYVSGYNRYLHTYVYGSTAHNSQAIEITHMSYIRQMDQDNVVYIQIYNGVLFSHRKNETVV